MYLVVQGITCNIEKYGSSSSSSTMKTKSKKQREVKHPVKQPSE